ncbi:MAG: VOC family protein [Gammaproteobacteria bacterium]
MAEDLGRLSVALGVADIERSVDFYRRLGFEPIEEDTWNDDYDGRRSTNGRVDVGSVG